MKLLALITIILLQGCSTTSTSTKPDIKLPNTSIVNVAPALASDVIRNIRTYIEKNHQCSNWRIVSAKTTLPPVGGVILTHKGQLHSGIITEAWIINQCGKNIDLGIVMSPDSNGGSLVAIANL